MAQETDSFSKHHNLDETLQNLMRKACKANAKYPLHFVAEEILMILQSDTVNKQLMELRKEVGRFQALLEHLKNRISSAKNASSEDEEKAYQEYCRKHDLRRYRTELIAVAYMAEADDPKLLIANYILRQPDTKIIERKETEDLEKRSTIYKNLIQKLISDNPMTLKEIQEFSTETVRNEILTRLQK